jgi:thymidylate synthase (FAD)
MPKFERVEDRWAMLRKDLYGNVEPEVTLEAITLPVKYPAEHVVGNRVDSFTDMLQVNLSRPDLAGPARIDARDIEQLPAIAAGVSYGSKEKLEGDSERCIKLNRKLIEQGHHTPLEAIQLNFFVSGISKACGAQISRHRAGQGHVSASRRFKTAGAGFIYPTYEYLDKERVLVELEIDELNNKASYGRYETKRKSGVKKEDARMVLPVSYATERSWFINARALRDFFRLRLAADAEWEIRRVAWMMYDMVVGLLPSLFEDMVEPKEEPDNRVAKYETLPHKKGFDVEQEKERLKTERMVGLAGKKMPYYLFPTLPPQESITIGIGHCKKCGAEIGSGLALASESGCYKCNPNATYFGNTAEDMENMRADFGNQINETAESYEEYKNAVYGKFNSFKDSKGRLVYPHDDTWRGELIYKRKILERAKEIYNERRQGNKRPPIRDE